MDRVQTLMARIPDAAMMPDLGSFAPADPDAPNDQRGGRTDVQDGRVSTAEARGGERHAEALFSDELTHLRRILVSLAFDRRGSDPIRSLSELGHAMINTSAGVIVVYALAQAKVDAAVEGGEAAGRVPVVGGLFQAVIGVPSQFISSLLRTIGLVLMALVGAMVISGLMLAYYLPMIPAIFWIFGILGWLIMIIESMIAAPLWAVSHAVPEGDGFAGRYALLGYQMLVNVIFRPILLLLGLLLAMMVMHIIAQFALWTLAVAMEAIVDIATGGIRGMLIWLTSAIAIVFIIGAVLIQLSHKVHEIIFETADNVMRWIGFGVSPLGSVKSGEASVMGTTRGGMGQLTQPLAQSLTSHRPGRNAPKSGEDGGGGGRGNEPSNAARKQGQADAPAWR